MRLIDVHCHLDFDQYDGDREVVMEECGERMEAVINSGTNVERNEASLELARGYGFVHATLGIHPTYIRDLEEGALDTVIGQVRKHADEVVAVGEIGMDYHHITEQAWRERQEEMLERMLELAAELGLPVVLHSRDAEKRVMEILSGYDPAGVVLHCFNGAPALAEEAVDRGYMVSVSTQVLYSNRVQNIVEAVPLEHITLETDAPFLYQGERNVPWNVAESAEEIAGIKGVAPDEVGRVTTENARAVFGL